jgi:glycogen operon protein
MLRMGDEFAHTQRGNNNVYCQDNEISWVDWSGSGPFPSYLELVGRLLELRRDHPVFRQRAFFEGRPVGSDGVKDLAWLRPDGAEMGDDEWRSPSARTIGMYVSGRGIRTRGPRGERIVDDSFLLWLHAGADEQKVQLPGPPWAGGYVVELDTSDDRAPDTSLDAGSGVTLASRSVLVLRATGL